MAALLRDALCCLTISEMTSFNGVLSIPPVQRLAKPFPLRPRKLSKEVPSSLPVVLVAACFTSLILSSIWCWDCFLPMGWHERLRIASVRGSPPELVLGLEQRHCIFLSGPCFINCAIERLSRSLLQLSLASFLPVASHCTAVLAQCCTSNTSDLWLTRGEITMTGANASPTQHIHPSSKKLILQPSSFTSQNNHLANA